LAWKAQRAGRQLSVAFARWGLDVREVNVRRTAQGRQRRRRGKTDRVDALAIAKETLAEPDLPLAGPTMALEPGHEELVALCAHRSALVKRRTARAQSAPRPCSGTVFNARSRRTARRPSSPTSAAANADRMKTMSTGPRPST